MGRSLPGLNPAYRTDDYLVKGCQSQVWLHAEGEEDRIRLQADSDALITKGLVAVLVRILDGQPAEEVANADLGFLDRIGMKEHLSPTRKNGLDAMIRKIRLYALALSQASQTS
jgi:cysteine desulfuration protein SufE